MCTCLSPGQGALVIYLDVDVFRGSDNGLWGWGGGGRMVSPIPPPPLRIPAREYLFLPSWRISLQSSSLLKLRGFTFSFQKSLSEY